MLSTWYFTYFIGMFFDSFSLCELIQLRHIVIILGKLVHVGPLDNIVRRFLQFWNGEGAVKKGLLVLVCKTERDKAIQQGLNPSLVWR